MSSSSLLLNRRVWRAVYVDLENILQYSSLSWPPGTEVRSVCRWAEQINLHKTSFYITNKMFSHLSLWSFALSTSETNFNRNVSKIRKFWFVFISIRKSLISGCAIIWNILNKCVWIIWNMWTNVISQSTSIRLLRDWHWLAFNLN